MNASIDNNAFEYWKIEYRGLIDALFNTWTLFNNSLRLYFSIVTIPITVFIGISRFVIGDNSDFDTAVIEPAFRCVSLIIGITGVLFYNVILHYSMDKILYAQLINGLRKVIMEKDEDISEIIKGADLPYDPSVPRPFQAFRHIGVLTLLTSILNGSYFYLACFGLTVHVWYLILFFILSVGVHYMLFYYHAHRPRISGETKTLYKQ